MTTDSTPRAAVSNGGDRDNPGDAQLFADLARALHDSTGDLDRAVDVIFAQAADLHSVPGEHASITIRRRRGRYESLGSTSPLASKVDQLQYDLDEGPCVAAASPQGEGWYRSGDLKHDTRWPQWGPAAADLGINSVLAVELLRNSDRLGAINIYAEQPSQFTDPHEVDRVLMWAVHAATALSAAWTEAGLHTAITARHQIGVAQGILMNALDIDHDAAFAYMARTASHQERKLYEVAEEIARTRRPPRTD